MIRKTTMTGLLKVAMAVLVALMVAIPFLHSERTLAAGGLAQADDPDDPLLIDLWQNGIVHYRFDDGTLGPVAVHAADQTLIEKQMVRWERALTISDPSTGVSRQYIDFRRCDADCSGNYLVIRYNKLMSRASPYGPLAECQTNNPFEVGKECECNNMSDPVGLEVRAADGSPDGITELHLRRGTCPEEATVDEPSLPVAAGARTNQTDQVILHELGHVLGLWHEFNRGDADAYLVEQPRDLDGEDFSNSRAFGTRDTTFIPVLGNYDYDSVMGYGGSQDLHTNPFSRQSAQAKTDDDPANIDLDGNYIIDYSLSPSVRSRILQLYAHERQPNWGFFRPVSAPPPPVLGNDDTDLLQRRDPYLAPPNVTPVGTPAIAFQSAGNYDIFARGSDDRLYWKAVRNNVIPVRWETLGSFYGSDPAAISMRDGQIDLFAVSSLTGKLIRKSYRNGAWGNAVYVQGGYPTGGIKGTDGNYLGAAVASRGPDALEVFVVRRDGRLSVTSLSNGQWTGWTSLGRDYNVTARPAAVAVSATRVQLAINENEVNLYEPVLTFLPELPSFRLGDLKGTTASLSSPALTKRDDVNNPYRVLITTADGRISHRFANGSWRDIGGIPKPDTGPSAVAVGRFGALIVMNGADLIGCDASCDNSNARNANGTFIEPGGLWVRLFN